MKPESANSTGNGGPKAAPLPLSVRELFDRCMGNAAVATLMLEKFEKQIRSDVRDLAERLEAQDAAKIAHTAHALKGAAGAVAAAHLRERAAEIERLAREDQLAAIGQELVALRSEIEHCLAYLPSARRELLSAPPLTNPGKNREDPSR